jgi:aerobic carbon-monoxide dehydrogenase medium subunit
VCAVVQRSNGTIEDARVGLTNMAMVPLRASAAERALAGAGLDVIADAAAAAAEGTEPPSDLNADGAYRQHLARVLTRRALEAATS